MDDQNKNLILATALSFLVILIWFVLFPPEDATLTPDAGLVPPVQQQAEEGALADIPAAAPPAGAASPTGDAAPDRDTDIDVTDAPRVAIDTPQLTGTISLVGGRIDDLSLKSYNETLDPSSGLVRLLSPTGTDGAYYALHGWAPGTGVDPGAVPDAFTEWRQTGGDTLSPGAPITLGWDNGAGLTFTRTISVDEDYLFSVDQRVENAGDAPVTLAPYGLIARHGEPDDLTGFFILHEGVVRMSDGELQEIDYGDMPDLEVDARSGGPADRIEVATDGWIGFTDKYWMTTLVPAPGVPFRSVVRYNPASDIYQTETVLPSVTVAPGAESTSQTRLFAGAKEWDVIRSYQNEGGIDGFLDSIDWGWFFFLTKPIFAVLHWLNGIIGNMGWSIIVLTLIIKAVLLPLAYKSYVSMAKMKELQPEMEKLKESAGDDRQKMQQGMMELYKKNKVNPASGCVPILLQIPIFFSLYKVIFVTIELRHAEWIGWIRDLSAPDPSSILNLFGLLPIATPDQGSIFFIFSLGILPILLGISMWLQQKLNPAPTDPTQRMIFAWMPWVFMFMLGSFASGLVLYWIANNTITFTQQYLIMRSQGIKPNVFGNIIGGLRKGAKADGK